MTGMNKSDKECLITLGKLFQKSGKYEKAMMFHQRLLQIEPRNAQVHFDLAACLSERKLYETAVQHFNLAYTFSGGNLVECLPNIAALFIKLGNPQNALDYCERALCCLGGADLHNPEVLSLAMYNLNVALRQLGRQVEAIDASWALVLSENTGSDQQSVTADNLFRPTIDAQAYSPRRRVEEEAVITVACVKWGTKYGPEYVNRLFSAVRRHLPVSSLTSALTMSGGQRRSLYFACFTDDAAGIELAEDVQIHPLPQHLEWSGWWWKAYLFSPECPLQGMVWYFDLDTVIVESLTPLLSYKGLFATLTTNEMLNEQREGGYNSSIMLWWSGELTQIFTFLNTNFSAVKRSIYKFDHWLEMMVERADILQEHYPKMIVEYLKECSLNLPKLCSIICFPLQPKPHQCVDVKWVSDHWI